MELKSTRAAKPRSRGSADNLAAQVFTRIKQEIFDFRLLPGDRFTETEVAERMQVSRTPVREALYQLEREGYVEVLFRAGWRVLPFDFKRLENLYDVRTVLEMAAVRLLCELPALPESMEALRRIWLVAAGDRIKEGPMVSTLDEAFHTQLVAACGNDELARIHADVSDRIRIVRRLEFTKGTRIEPTYVEHGKILRSILQRRGDQAQMLLRAHIETAKAEVRKITIHMLHEAREQAQTPAPALAEDRV